MVEISKSWKQDWINALKSGKYKQGKDYLHYSEEDSYCCLGVLCKVLNIKEIDDDCQDGSMLEYKGVESDVDLPGPLREELNISVELQNRLISMNDKQNMSFAEIADFLEKKFSR